MSFSYKNDNCEWYPAMSKHQVRNPHDLSTQGIQNSCGKTVCFFVVYIILCNFRFREISTQSTGRLACERRRLFPPSLPPVTWHICIFQEQEEGNMADSTKFLKVSLWRTDYTSSLLGIDSQEEPSDAKEYQDQKCVLVKSAREDPPWQGNEEVPSLSTEEGLWNSIR